MVLLLQRSVGLHCDPFDGRRRDVHCIAWYRRIVAVATRQRFTFDGYCVAL